MSSAAIKAGQAFIEILAQDKTKGTLDSVQARLRSFAVRVGAIGASLTAVASSGLAGLWAMAQQFADAGSTIGDAMARTGIGSDMLQTLGFAAEMAGSNLGAVEGAARKLNQTIGRAAGGNKAAAKALDGLGLSAQELLGLSPDERIALVIDRLSQITDPAQRAAAAMQVLGKSSSALNEVIDAGAAGLAETQKMLRDSGLMLSQGDIANAAALGDAWDKLTSTMARAVQLIGASVAPLLLQVIEKAQSLVTWITQLINANRGLFVTLAIGLTILAAVGLALMGVAAAAALVSFVIGGIATVFAALMSPVGIAIMQGMFFTAVILGLIAAFDQLVLGGAGLQFLIDVFSELWSIASQVIEGVYNALASGNWGLAMAIAMAGVNVAWVTGWAWLKIGFHDFATWLLQAMTELFGTQVIGIVLRGMKWILDKIKGAADYFGLDSGINTKGFDSWIKAAEKGPDEFKKKTLQSNEQFRKEQQRDIDRAKKLLGGLTLGAALGNSPKLDLQAKQLAKVERPNFADMKQQTAAFGASSAAAAERLAYTQPVFDKIEEHLSDHTDLLEKIADNTEDGGDEGLGD